LNTVPNVTACSAQSSPHTFLLDNRFSSKLTILYSSFLSVRNAWAGGWSRILDHVASAYGSKLIAALPFYLLRPDLRAELAGGPRGAATRLHPAQKKLVAVH